VRKLDRQRLGLEEHIEDALKNLQRWEADRLQSVKTVLLQLYGTLSNISRALEAPIKRSASHIAAISTRLRPFCADLNDTELGHSCHNHRYMKAWLMTNRTYSFGIDLRRWSEGGWNSLHGETQNKPLVPPVLTTLLDGLTKAYPQLQNDVGESAVLLALEHIVTVAHRETQGLDLRSSFNCSSSPP